MVTISLSRVQEKFKNKMSLTEQLLVTLLEQTLSNSQEMVSSATEQILLHRRSNDFLGISFLVSANPQVSSKIRSAAAIQFSNDIATKVQKLDGQMLVNISLKIVQTVVEAADSGALIVVRQMLESLKTILEFFYMSFNLHPTINPAVFAGDLYQLIFSLIDNSSVSKTDVCIQMVTILLTCMSSESLKDIYLKISVDFFDRCLNQLLQYLCSIEGEITNYVTPPFIEHVFACLNSFLTYSTVQSLTSLKSFSSMIGTVCQLLEKIGIGIAGPEVRNAKDYALQILIQLSITARLVGRCISPETEQSYLLVWNENEERIGKLLLGQFCLCPDYDLWEDHSSLDSLFRLSCRLIETNRGVPYNPKAYNLLVSNGKDIIQAIIAMLYNAGDLRLGQFEENDLLVIDCLKPCLDFLSSLTATSRELLELVNADMHMRLNSIINNDTAFLDTPEGQVNFFVGIILLRRGLSDDDTNYKGMVIFASLINYTKLNPIVFEELSKLIISITTEENSYISDFNEIDTEYTGDIEALLQKTVAQGIDAIKAGLDFKAQLVYILGCLYLLPTTSFFQCRMLSGIMARCVRHDLINRVNQRHLLLRSLELIATSQENSAAGGMVTFCRVAFPGLGPDVGAEVLSMFLRLPVIQNVFSNYNRMDPKLRKTAEMICETVNLVVTNVDTVSISLEECVCSFVVGFLQKDIRASQGCFQLLNCLLRKSSSLSSSSQNAYDYSYGPWRTDLIELLIHYLDSFYQTPGDFIFSNASHVEDMLAEALPYLIIQTQRFHMAYKNSVTQGTPEQQIEKLNEIYTPFFTLINKLLSPMNSAILLSVGCFILTRVMSLVALESNNVCLTVLQHSIQKLIELVSNLPTVCQGLMTHNLTPDLKRCMLVSISMAFFTLLQITDIHDMAENLLSTIAPHNLKIMIFISAWSIADNEGNPFIPLRAWMAHLVCCLSKIFVTLTQKDPTFLSVVVPNFAWAYSLCKMSHSPVVTAPQLDFSSICNSGIEIDILQPIFSGLNSQFTRFSNIAGNNKLPLYEGFLTTHFENFFNFLPRQIFGEVPTFQHSSSSFKFTALQASIRMLNLQYGDEFSQFLIKEINDTSGSSLLHTTLSGYSI